MATATQEPQTLRRAMLLMTTTSFLVPAAGVLTAPILARALDPMGRGELAAAQAPAALMLAIATLGLPDALTFHLAKRPGMTRATLARAGALTLGLGVLSLLLTWPLAPVLSSGDRELGRLILLAAVLTVPALLVGLVRGAATGRQMWGAVAAERLITTTIRVVGLLWLWVLGDLTVLSALLVSALAPVIAGLAYWRLLVPVPLDHGHVAGREVEGREAEGGEVETRALISFGLRVWMGSVASMMLARVGQVIMAPLSSVEDLGLYMVATTISDVPLIVALAVQGALYGVHSRTTDSDQLTAVSRVTLLIGFVGCTVLALGTPFLIGPLFGDDFTAATVPTIILLGSAVICVPGLMAASGIAAWGRPGLRSVGLGVTLATNVAGFVLLVPPFGVYGACWTSLLNNVVMTTYMVVVASKVVGVPARAFVLIGRRDVRRALSEARRLARRVLPTRSRRTA